MRVCLPALFLIPILVTGQGINPVAPSASKIDHYIKLYNQTDGTSSSTHKVLTFAEKLERKRPLFKQDKDFLEYLFNKTHQHFLKHYTDHASFGTMLDHGTYNCLTGTALYAILLDHFGIDFQIIETNYHIFLLAHMGHGSILFETTDPTAGFVSDSREIEKRITLYKQNSIQPVKSTKTYYRYNFDLYNEVNLDQMQGLLHYNLSVVAYNQQKLPVSIDQLGKAITLYQSPRIEEFSRLILLAVMESNLESALKEECIKGLQSMRNRHLAVTASVN